MWILHYDAVSARAYWRKGSGKSTLTSIIAGINHYDSGEMERNGEAYHPASVIDAQAKGVAMIVQEMGTASNITVTENIFIGKGGHIH